jgi:acetyl esterase
VSVVHRYEKTMPHGFLNFAKAFPKAGTIPLEAGEFLRQQFPDHIDLSKAPQ